jgi:iron complex transport system permease protein
VSHLNGNHIPAEYLAYTRRKMGVVVALIVLCAVLFVVALALGAVRVPLAEIVRAIAGAKHKESWSIIILDIRLPHALAALIAGAGLAAAGAVMQSILRNPLGSPFTLGLSQAAAFGAAFAVMGLDAGVMQSTQINAVTIARPGLTALSAFAACMIAASIIIGIGRLRGASPEVLVLSGVAIGSLFAAGTMFLQYFADDVQLAAMVFWTFGDVGRAGWSEVGYMASVVVTGYVFFLINRWNYNAIDAGDETARALGVHVGRVRLLGMVVAAMLTAVIVAFLGVIGFVGLICPHIARRIVGDDHRFLLPTSCLTGSALLLAADTAARLILAPHVLPVAVLTSFLGAPAFLYLLLRRRAGS